MDSQINLFSLFNESFSLPSLFSLLFNLSDLLTQSIVLLPFAHLDLNIFTAHVPVARINDIFIHSKISSYLQQEEKNDGWRKTDDIFFGKLLICGYYLVSK